MCVNMKGEKDGLYDEDNTVVCHELKLNVI